MQPLPFVIYVFIALALAHDEHVSTGKYFNEDHSNVSPTFNVTCGHSIVVMSDTDLSIVAKCSNGKKYYKSDPYLLTVEIPISFTREKVSECSLYQFPKKHVYSLQVSVSHMHRSRTRADIKEYVITCSFERHGRVVSKKIPLDVDSFNYEEIIINEGKMVDIKVSLFLENMNGQKITEKIEIGRKVKLVAKVEQEKKEKHGSSGVKGILLRNCYASDEYENITILQAGCSNGNVFPVFSGFKTNGLVAKSPFFTMFQLVSGSTQIQFECTFVVCKTPCDDDSCMPGAQKVGVAPENFLHSHWT
ncbi:vitelline envelope sperm lysin receptor-like isoform X2 [Octopus sinensis]|uniref:Vitelline envelope sperm lysin receptor-like isoform X2 n=1 Tax=Octopus sinensis TaxID=2607531 RepID=A0A7E6FQJ3_9MOLL|nr:vitelline envelope sperm lysin receptor-like isoform X2 [Octopus sinensis]